ncbi:hypothetical protein ACFE04_002548 [Oxalis oulophora]
MKGFLFLIFLICILLNFTQAATKLEDNQENELKMVPLMEEKMVTMMMMFNETKRRQLGSFQTCAICKCCGGNGAKRICLASPCCYAINCNIPNRPFGFCSFTPKTCNCFGCHY